VKYWLFLSLLATSQITLANDWFLNADQQAKAAFEQGEYSKAAELFTDFYQKGVALYRDKKYAEAIEALNQVQQPELQADTFYNTGNAYYQQGKYTEAIQAYEKVLKMNPQDQDAQKNLALAKQHLPPPSEKSDSQQNDKDQSSKDKESVDNQSDQQHSANSQQNDKNQSSKDKESADNQSDQQQSAHSQRKEAEQSQQLADSQHEQQQGMNAQSQEKSTQLPTESQAKTPQQTAAQTTLKEAAEQAAQQEVTSQADDKSLTEQAMTMPNEADVMADVLLNRIESKPEELLRNQFYIDAYRQKITPTEKNTW